MLPSLNQLVYFIDEILTISLNLIDLIEEVATGAMLKLNILSNNPMSVNESYIRDIFNKFGKVSRFEVKNANEDAQVSLADDTVIGMDKTHEELLKDYLEGTSGKAQTKNLALRTGKRILAEVLSDA